MQEVRTAVVQQVDPSVRVRIWADSDDIPVAVKAAGYTPTVGDKVALIKLGTRDGWCISHKVDAATVRPREWQDGLTQGTTDSSGQLVVTFPVEFDALPVVHGTAMSTSARMVTLSSRTTTTATFTYRNISDGSTLTSTTYVVHWSARGVLAT